MGREYGAKVDIEASHNMFEIRGLRVIRPIALVLNTVYDTLNGFRGVTAGLRRKPQPSALCWCPPLGWTL